MALAKWYKIDFHTHTPESNCFPDKRVTPEQWLQAAKDSGINAVVVSDHNSVGWISKLDSVKGKYEDNNFKVFYGIELCVSSDFTHFLIIFDDKMSIQEIEDAVVGELGLQRRNWANTEISVSEDKLKELVKEYRDRIFVIPAHFASNKGLGKCSENAIKKYQEFLYFAAVEVRNDEDVREYYNKIKNKAINHCVLVTGSDNPSNKDQSQHSIEGFGKMFTWVKISTLSFEGLRQVFIDPEHRCINWIDLQKVGVEFDPNEITYNYISGIEVDGISHMTKMNMRFSPNLNCIVGGRGTGKSTIVDAINYGVGNERDLAKCKLLEKTMSKGSSITTYFNFGIAKPYMIITKRKGKQLLSEVKDENGRVEDPPEFKIDFYGQKEIFSLIDEDDNIANQNNSPLVKMIDDKISADMYPLSDEIGDAILNMQKYSDEYKSNRRRIKELPTIKAEIEKAEAILKKFKASGIEKTRSDYEAIDLKIKNIERAYTTELDIVNSANASFVKQCEDLERHIGELDENDENAFERESLKKLNDINNSLIASLNHAKNKIEELKENYKNSDSYIKREAIYNRYLEALEEVRNTGGEDINSIQNQLQKNKQRYSELILLQEKQGDIEHTIEDCIEVFLNKRLELSQKRQDVIDALDLENISINVIPLGHLTRWKANLQKELGKEGTFDSDFQKLVEQALSGKNSWQKYKSFLKFLLITDTGNIEELFGASSDVRFTRLWNDKFINDTLSSMVKVLPEDKLQIQIVDENGSIDINEGSPGQKSAAILAFILNSGENPLIIDQPEDDLDNSLIYSLVVKSIRKMKGKRQIVIVTHNPNIPVLGDAEGIIVLERNNAGKVTFRKNKKAGCIEEKLIREGICEIMEGGEDAFRKRELKYQHR